jgi:polyribonucleotide nucleotidyltransferase
MSEPLCVLCKKHTSIPCNNICIECDHAAQKEIIELHEAQIEILKSDNKSKLGVIQNLKALIKELEEENSALRKIDAENTAYIISLKENLSQYEWKDISRLPKDGKIYALINGNCLTSGRFDVETGEIFSHCHKTVTATHWREVDPVDIYTPPSTQEGDKE